MIDETEYEDFYSILEKNRYSINDFKIIPTENSISPTGIQALTGSLIVKRISTNKENNYNCGHGTQWISEFDVDLNKGVFD